MVLTIVSFGTSFPELVVSVNAALSGHADISMGNVVGSNIANLALVLGITAHNQTNVSDQKQPDSGLAANAIGLRRANPCFV